MALIISYFFQHNKSPDQQAEALLDTLVLRGPDAFEQFCEALKADFQEHIVDLYLKPKEEEKSKCESTSNRVPNNEQAHVETSYIRIHSHVTVPSNSESHLHENSSLAVSGSNITTAVQPRPHSSPPRLISPPDNHHQLIFHYTSKSRDPNQNLSEEELIGEARYKFQHYISDPYYAGLNNVQPRDVKTEGFQNVNNIPHQNNLSPRKYMGNRHILIRNDSTGN